MADLFEPLVAGELALAHRVVLAPLTRMRAGPGNVPTALMAEYYAQRTTPGGLLIAEATQVCPEGQGNPATPGIHTAAQIAGWRAVTEAVHARGGVIVLQLWHVGRVSHSSHQPGGGRPVAPSAVPPPVGQALGADWQRVPFEVPRPLETAEIPGLVATYAAAARNALAAGFDGVEVHGANGYLLEQFLHAHSNHRTDAYGGSIANRARLMLEVTAAVAAAAGPGRTGIRLSPYGDSNGSGGEAAPMPLYTHVLQGLAPMGLAYLHLIEPRSTGAGRGAPVREGVPSSTALFRPLWPGVLIGAGGYDRAGALAAVAEGTADAVAFGRYFISNPDLPERLRRDAPFTPYDRASFYGGTAAGYTDYPFLAA